MNENFNGFRMPAEWEPQNSVWIAWPYNKNDWPGLFEKIPNVVGKIIKYLTKHQKVDLLVNNTKSIGTTRIYLKKIGVLDFIKLKSLDKMYNFTKKTSFVEVYLLAIVVGYIKLDDISDVTIHNNIYFFIAYNPFQF